MSERLDERGSEVDLRTTGRSPEPLILLPDDPSGAPTVASVDGLSLVPLGLELVEAPAPVGPAAPRARALVVAALVLGLAAAGTGLVVAQHEAARHQAPRAALSRVADVRRAMLAAPSWSGVARYRLTDPSRPGRRATVTLTRSGPSTRVDVATAAVTASLMTAPQGWVACTTAVAGAPAIAPTCLLVAPPGGSVPAAFDPELQTLLTTTLPALAAPGAPAHLEAAAPLPATARTGRAGCARAEQARSAGTYCLSADGLLHRAVTAGSDLELLTSTPTVDAAVFLPPVTPVPL